MFSQQAIQSTNLALCFFDEARRQVAEYTTYFMVNDYKLQLIGSIKKL